MLMHSWVFGGNIWKVIIFFYDGNGGVNMELILLSIRLFFRYGSKGNR